MYIFFQLTNVYVAPEIVQVLKADLEKCQSHFRHSVPILKYLCFCIIATFVQLVLSVMFPSLFYCIEFNFCKDLAMSYLCFHVKRINDSGGWQPKKRKKIIESPFCCLSKLMQFTSEKVNIFLSFC